MAIKTNVMRILDKEGINYNSYTYDDSKAISGVEVAQILNQDPKRVFKTLVTTSGKNKYYVFMVPVECELDLKKAASCVGEKSIEMIKQKDLFPLTGYVHGGCSPIGMKKFFPTTIDSSSKNFDMIIFSAGKIGYQVELNLEDLKKLINLNIADIIKN